jgi:hypothetical protein
MDISSIDYMQLTNFMFCLAIVALGIIRYRNTDVKAFLFIGLAYALFSLSWIAQIAGLDEGVVKSVLTVVRMGGYSMLIIGLLL